MPRPRPLCQFKILSYNVNFGSFLPEAAYLPSAAAQRVMEACINSDADMILLQETNEGWQNFFESECVTGKISYAVSWISPEPYGFYAAGSAVLVNKDVFELIEVNICPTATEIAGSYFDQMLVRLRLVGSGLQFSVLNLHLRPPLSMGSEPSGLWDNAKVYLSTSSTIHAAELSFCVRHCELTYGAPPALIVGDFNENSGGAVQACGDLGLLDAAKGKGRTWEWPLKFGLKLFGWYDHLFYDPLQFRVNDAEVMTLFRDASDHLPVVASLSFLDPLAIHLDSFSADH